MSAIATPPKPAVPVHYPDDDGLPMSDNTLQMKWIFLLYGNLRVQYAGDENTFVAANHLIYPVEGDNKTRQAPDVFIAFDRPNVDRGSYRVWQEGGVFPQVVFEVWSPGNRYADMQNKFAFYERHGAEEYYILYPEFPAHAEGYVRADGKLTAVTEMDGYVSPRTGLRFTLGRGQLTVLGRDGQPLRTPEQLVAEREAAEREAEGQRQKADAAAQKADAAAQKAAALAAKLRELGVDPDAV